jgi:cytoskeleton protein RodZ
MNIAEQISAHEPQPVAAEPVVSQTFIAARQAQNLSLTDVANRLKLSVHQIEALEQGAYDRLPGAVFVRGFTRNYARLLKLDPEEMVRAVDAHLPRVADRNASAGETNIPMPAKNSSRWPLVAGIAAVVFLGAALVDVLWPETPPSSVAVAPKSAPESQEAITQSTAAASPAPVADSSTVAPVAPVAPESAAAVPAVSAADPATHPAAAVTANYLPSSTSDGTVLRLAFDRQSWVQVRDASGRVVLESLFPPGSSREITARPPLTLIVGNAPGVRLTYAGRAIDLAPHTRVAVARLTLE